MKIRNFARIRSATPIMELVQDSLAKFFRPLEVNPYLDGVELEISITGGANSTFNHGLGRTPVGWWTTDLDTDTTVFRVSWTETEIVLTANNSCSGKVWVS